jgi:DNA-binding XRE family transcriptional regulator
MNSLELKELRKKQGLTQQQLANLIGVSLKTVQNYEKGEVIPETKHEILRNVLNPMVINEPNTEYKIIQTNCEEKLQNAIKEIELKNEIIELLKEKIHLLKK